jgi:hypothetical protein
MHQGAPHIQHRVFQLANGSEHTWKMAMSAENAQS